MNGSAKGTFDPVEQIMPDPNEPDWMLPKDLPSKEEIEGANRNRSGELESSVLERSGSSRHLAAADEVTAAFSEIASILESRIADLNNQGASLFKASNHAAAAEKAEQGKKLTNFLEKTASLQTEWLSMVEILRSTKKSESKEGLRNFPGLQKRSPKRMAVTFDDGSVISESSSGATFSKCISKIGVHIVQGLELEKYGHPLISATKPGKYSSTLIEGLYLITHFNAEDKRAILMKISEMTGVRMKISII